MCFNLKTHSTERECPYRELDARELELALELLDELEAEEELRLLALELLELLEGLSPLADSSEEVSASEELSSPLSSASSSPEAPIIP